MYGLSNGTNTNNLEQLSLSEFESHFCCCKWQNA